MTKTKIKLAAAVEAILRTMDHSQLDHTKFNAGEFREKFGLTSLGKRQMVREIDDVLTTNGIASTFGVWTVGEVDHPIYQFNRMSPNMLALVHKEGEALPTPVIEKVVAAAVLVSSPQPGDGDTGEGDARKSAFSDKDWAWLLQEDLVGPNAEDMHLTVHELKLQIEAYVKGSGTLPYDLVADDDTAVQPQDVQYKHDLRKAFSVRERDQLKALGLLIEGRNDGVVANHTLAYLREQLGQKSSKTAPKAKKPAPKAKKATKK